MVKISIEPLPQRSISQPTVEYAPQKINWLVVLLCSVIVFLLANQFKGCSIEDNPGPSPGIDGTFVLVLEDENSTPRKDWDQGQVQSLAEVVKWAEKNCSEYEGIPAWRILDVSQNLKEDQKVWEDIKATSKIPPPTVLIGKDGKVKEFALPEDVELTLRTLDKLK